MSVVASASRRTSRGRSIPDRLDPRNNSLNLIRLLLASAVVVHHTSPLGGFASSPPIFGLSLGSWAVNGFFAISGYLITGSRHSRRLTEYLAHRVARIYPAFWVCLVVTAAVFAPVDYVRSHGTVDGYLTTGPITPINYILINASLRINSFGIGTTLTDVPYPVAWNGSLWTLYYEFLCYLLIGALGLLAWWRRRAWLTLAMFGLSVLMAANVTMLDSYLSNPHATNFINLLPYFLGGSLVYMLRGRLPLTLAGLGVSTGLLLLALWISPTLGGQLSAPAYAYILLFIGSRLPSPRIIQRNDISYGLYIYAFPVQQLLAVMGAASWGSTLFSVASLTFTIPFATASWLLIERPAMRRAKRGTQPAAATQPPAGPDPAVRSLEPAQ